MATTCLFRDDAYLKECEAKVAAVTDTGGIVLDRTVFYAVSGGQPADRGALALPDGRRIAIDNVVYADTGKTEIAHVPTEGSTPLAAGDTVRAVIDWGPRYARMRMHTAL